MIELLPFAALVLYLVPFFVAAVRNHHHPMALLAFNLLAGWTGIGWFAALAWAWTGSESPRVTPPGPGYRTVRTVGPPDVMPRILDNPTSRE